MPKKVPPNPFYYYMKEIQDQMRERGQRVPSMKEMPALVSPAWNRLTADEKAPYEDMARAYKRNRSQTDDGRFTSDGIPIQVLKQQADEAEESVRAVETAVRNLVKTFTSTDEIAQSSFFIMGFNILVGTLDELYLPNEIGIVEYSIKDGIRSEYHKFIDPGLIPVGYMSAAKVTSETVHEIPISGFALATMDYSRLYKEIKHFLGLQNHSEARYIFCHPNETNQFQRCLDWIKENSGTGSKEEIIIASLASLVAELKSAANNPYSFMSTAVDAISTNSFDYSPNTLCSFHDEKDNKYCALGYCKRLAYTLSDILCIPFGVAPTSKHFPERTTVMETITWEPKRDLRPVVNNVDVQAKPLAPHFPTTIVKNIRSKFDDEPDYRILPSALSDTSSVVSESIDLEDSSAFPSLSGKMSQMSIGSASQSVTVNSGSSWAQVSSKNKPLRAPRSLPESMRMDQHARAAPKPPAMGIPGVGLGRGAGIGRGRGLNFNNNK